MKKILFATTALVATAGVAAADVTFGGYGRFGVLYIEGAADETSVTSRYRLTIDGTTEADNGLTFGARVRIQQNAGDGAGTGINAARFHVAASGLEVAVGNIYGAMDSMPGLYAGSVGLTGLGWGNVVSNFGGHSYSSGGNGAAPEGVEVIYSAGNFGAHVSHGNDRTELAGSFNMNDWTIGAAFADDDAPGSTQWILTAGGKVGMAGIGLAVADNDGAMHYTLSGSFEVGAATTVVAYVAQDESKAEENAYGLGVVHNLGGGASIRGGVVDLHGTTRADMGVLFNF